jgi:hypothetical protein
MRAAVLWSGGREFNFAYDRATAQVHDAAILVTFILDGGSSLYSRRTPLAGH